MKFGKTTEDQIKSMIRGYWKYAYLPTKMSDGTWVWLQEYFEHYKGFLEKSSIDYDRYVLYTSGMGGPFGPGDLICKRFAELPNQEYCDKYMADLRPYGGDFEDKPYPSTTYIC